MILERIALLPRQALVLLVRLYQRTLAPFLGLITGSAYGQTCRFHPSCSEYAAQALLRHGVLQGSWLAVRRLGRCHPWNPGGVDHVPPVGSATPTASTLTETMPTTSAQRTVA